MSIPARIVEQIRGRITTGTLRPGDRLPSTRLYAEQHQVSRGSVVAAYEQLVGEGYLVTSHAGTQVNPALPAPLRQERPSTALPKKPRPRGDLRPGVTDATALTTREWRSAWRIAAAEPRPHPIPGSPRLRALLAEHLRLTRAVNVSPADIVVTLGARDGLRLITQATSGPIAVEDPGFPTLHEIPRALGREVIKVPVDEEGIDIAMLERLQPSLVLVMPNHQYPTGRQMSAARRLQLIEWASGNGTIIAEDDYDSELRRTHPALAALGGNLSVALLGSFAKTLTPALGLGYLVVPAPLRDEVLLHALPVSGIVQDAMANFLETDGVRKHTARMRREYTKRRAIFAEYFPAGVPMDGGLHAVIELHDDESATIERCRERGLAVEGLSNYWSGSERAGIVIGLGTHSKEKLRELLAELREVLISECDEHDSEI